MTCFWQQTSLVQFHTWLAYKGDLSNNRSGEGSRCSLCQRGSLCVTAPKELKDILLWVPGLTALGPSIFRKTRSLSNLRHRDWKTQFLGKNAVSGFGVLISQSDGNPV